MVAERSFAANRTSVLIAMSEGLKGSAIQHRRIIIAPSQSQLYPLDWVWQ